jgi:gliding motility-associated-like protein
MVRLFCFLIIFLYVTASFKLARGQCVQIESILVDGCFPAGDVEGPNEMVRFRVGSTDLNVADMFVRWPNNRWRGLDIGSSTLAAKIAQINSTITNCGRLVEPTGNILPAFSKVLLFTSTDFDPLVYSFANLEDTLLVIAQKAGNTAGHFANFDAIDPSPERTLAISFTNPSGCNATATYNRTLLTRRDGTRGPENGARADFDGTTVSYVNYGCQVPFFPLKVLASINNNNDFVSVCESELISLAAAGSHPGTYDWKSSGNGTLETINNSQQAGYRPSSTDTLVTFVVTLTRSAAAICVNRVTSDTVRARILRKPSFNLLATIDSSSCIGKDITLRVDRPLNADTLNWLFNGSILSGFQDTFITIRNISASNAGTYRLRAANECGESLSPEIRLKVSSPLNFVPEPDTFIKACVDQSLVLKLQKNHTIANLKGYRWLKNNALLISVDTTQLDTQAHLLINRVSYSDSGYYSLQLIGDCGVQTIRNFYVEVAEAPSFAALADSVIVACPNSSVILRVGPAPANATFYWERNSILDAVVRADTLLLPAVGPADSGVYRLKAVNACGEAYSRRITVIPATIITAPVQSDTFIQACVGSSVILAGPNVSGFSGLQWYKDTTAISGQTAGILAFNNLQISDTGNYKLKIIGTCNSVYSRNFRISVIPRQNVSFTGADSIYCNPDANRTIRLIGSPSGGQFYLDGRAVPPVLGLPTQTGSYQIKYLVINGECRDSVVKTFSVYNTLADVSAGRLRVCVNDTIKLRFSGLPADARQPINLDSVTVLQRWGEDSAVVRITRPGNFTFRLNVAIGNCISADSVTVAAELRPEAIIESEPATPCTLLLPDARIRLDGTRSVGAVRYRWTIGDSIFETPTVDLLFRDPGLYYATLQVFSASGSCTDSVRSEFIYVPDDFVYVPNVFTPNGDGINDRFEIRIGDALQLPGHTYTLDIYDRWGQRVFNTTNPTELWDGRNALGEVRAGAYMYTLKITRPNNKTDIVRTGTVNIVR